MTSLSSHVEGVSGLAGVRIQYLHPTDERTLFAECVVDAGSKSREYFAVSRDGGRVFHVLGDATDFTMLAIASSDSRIWYRVSQRRDLLISDSAGEGQWTHLYTLQIRDPARVLGGGEVKMMTSDIAISPHDAGTVFAATSKGLLRTLDHGKTWCLMNLGIRNANSVNNVIFEPKEGRLVFVATDYGAFVSSDTGQTWSRFSLDECLGKEEFAKLAKDAVR